MTYSVNLQSERGRNLEAFEKAALKEFGSNKEVTLTWGKEINFRITGNFQPIVEKYSKVKKAISENQGSSEAKALKNAIEKIIGDVTLGTIHNQHLNYYLSGAVCAVCVCVCLHLQKTFPVIRFR